MPAQQVEAHRAVDILNALRMKDEFDVLGVDFHTRGRRFDECIEVLRK